MTFTRLAAMLAVLVALLTVAAPATDAQTISNTTTLSAAITATQNTFAVASSSNITTNTGPSAAWKLWIPTTGEVMDVQAIPSSGNVQVRRGAEGTFAQSAASGATVVILQGAQFTDVAMSGSCTRGVGYALYSPLVSRKIMGDHYVCRSSAWQTVNSRVVTYNSLAPFTP